MGACSFFREVPQHTDEVAQDDDAIAVRCQCNTKDLDAETWRLSFFQGELLSVDDLDKLNDEDFLGYCVVRRVKLPNEPERRIWVYEAVVRWQPLLNNYLHCCSVFTSSVAGREFRVKGGYFAQQNGLTYVCCQSALKMVLKHMKELLRQDKSYADINAALGIDHRKSGVGTYAGQSAGGVDFGRIEDLFSSLAVRLEPREYYFDPSKPHAGVTDIVYPYVESGLPALLFFKGSGAQEGHVIPVVGHTCNSDSWVPLAEKGYGIPTVPTYSTASWADHLVVHDDNYGMYMCLARDCLCRWQVPSACAPAATGMPAATLQPQAEFSPLSVVVLLPQAVNRSPLNVEMVSAVILQAAFEQCLPTGERWQRRLRDAFMGADEPPVLRTFLSSKALYVRHMETARDSVGATVGDAFIEELKKQLPDTFWISEITLRDLYSGNHRKLGEILSDAAMADVTDPNHFGASWLTLRVPGIGLVRSADKTSVSPFDVPLNGHTGLLRLLSPRPNEW